MKFKRYNGPDKYHFRVYKGSVGHPFLVVAVKEEIINGKISIDGYMLTHSLERVCEKPGAYKRLQINPNPNDDKPVFICKFKIYGLPSNKFSKPYPNWHLSKQDEKLIDKLEKHNKE